MKIDANAGYREIEHTADWELEVWAPNLEGLLEQSARGMYVLSGALLKDIPRQERNLLIPFSDPESLLVEFLSELLYFGESEGLGFDQFDIQIEGSTLHGVAIGAPFEVLEKEIKAVTFHNLEVRPTERGLGVRIVFDV